MSSKTKIIVLHMKEVVYTAIFLLLAILLGILIFFMFGPGKTYVAQKASHDKYISGIYRSAIHLDGNTFDVAVTVDADRIQTVSLENLSETTAAMYPLMKPSMETLAKQICSCQSLENITFSDDARYTSQVLLAAVSQALKKAENP